MIRKSIFWIILFALVFALGAGVYLFRGTEGTTATLWVDGELYKTVDLSAVTESYEFDVVTEYGTNTIRVSPGEIQVVSADCPEQLCVMQGSISDSAIPITCLPHRLVIQIEED